MWFAKRMVETVMWIDYAQLIQELVEERRELEKAHRNSRVADRIKMLRLLKTGSYRSQLQVAEVRGYTARQLRRWWGVYCRGGLAALLCWEPRGGKPERLNPAALNALEAEMRAGRIGRLREAQRFLRERLGIDYRGVSGLSRLYKRHRIELKTGRRRHRKADAEVQAAFKKTSLNS
jgi:transposase